MNNNEGSKTMRRMTKTEAAKIMTGQVRAAMRKRGGELSLRMCEDIINEYLDPIYEGRYAGVAAKIANPKTVHRMVKKELEILEWALQD